MIPTNSDFYEWLLNIKPRKQPKIKPRTQRVYKKKKLMRRWYHGYIQMYKPNHHFEREGYVMEHRLCWEYYNNAILMPWAVVQHKNGKISDNRIENLEAGMKSQYKGEFKTLKTELPKILAKLGI